MTAADRKAKKKREMQEKWERENAMAMAAKALQSTDAARAVDAMQPIAPEHILHVGDSPPPGVAPDMTPLHSFKSHTKKTGSNPIPKVSTYAYY